MLVYYFFTTIEVSMLTVYCYDKIWVW